LNVLNKYRPLVLLLVAFGGVVLFVMRAGGGFPLDDSWIHQSYGRNLALRGEWALIPGQPSAASTAPLYTVLLAVGYLLRLPYQLWAHLLGVLALWGIGVFGAQLTDRIAPDVRYAGVWSGVLLVMTWQLVWAAASGMETALFAMWTVLLPLLALRETDPDRDQRPAAWRWRGVLFGAVAGLALLTRPEGIIAAGVAGLIVLIIRPGGWRGLVWWVGAAAVSFAVLLIPYLWLNLSLTGGFLPNTSAAKQVQHAPLLMQPYAVRLRQMIVPLAVGGQFLLLPGLLVFVWRAVRGSDGGVRGVWLLWPVALVALYAARLPAAYQHGRYVMPALPLLIVAGAVGTLTLWRWGRRRLITRVMAQAVAASAFAVVLVMLVAVGPGVYARDVAVINEEMVTAAHWIDENIPLGGTLAIHDIGAVAYITPRPLIDIAGLVSPELIPYINRPAAMWDYLQAQGADYLMAFPDQIPGDDPTDPRLCEVFTTGGPTAIELGAANMAVYRLVWGESCDA
jgi:hypothetical protein